MRPHEATCFEGPRLAAFIMQQRPDAKVPPADRRAIQRWANGVQATLGTADRVLVNIGLSLDELPDDCGRAYRNGRHGWRKPR